MRGAPLDKTRNMKRDKQTDKQTDVWTIEEFRTALYLTLYEEAIFLLVHSGRNASRSLCPAAAPPPYYPPLLTNGIL